MLGGNLDKRWPGSIGIFGIFRVASDSGHPKASACAAHDDISILSG